MIWILAAFASDGFERVDVFAEDGSAWWTDDLARIGVAPGPTALRWASQVRVVGRFRSMVLGVSVASQNIGVRRPLTRELPLFAHAGISTRLGFPNGVSGGVELWRGPVRVAVGLQARSSASWTHPQWTDWRVVPGIGLSFGRAPVPPPR